MIICMKVAYERFEFPKHAMANLTYLRIHNMYMSVRTDVSKRSDGTEARKGMYRNRMKQRKMEEV